MRVALLTNFVAPYRIPVFRALRDLVGDLRIFVSTAMERSRTWAPEWADLDVVVQRAWTIQRRWVHERFTEPYELHVPYDTVPRLASWRPDVVVTAELGLRSAQAIAYARAAGKPVVVWATLADHLEGSRGRARLLWRRGLVRLPSRFLVNGESGARYIRSIGGEASRIVRVPQAIDARPFTDVPLVRPPEVARRLLFCGAVSELKGADLMIEGVRLWCERSPGRSLGLTVVGTGPLRNELERRPLPPGATVEWVGAVEYAELARWYARTGILLFPTRGDEWGLVVNEAMAAGMPVIGSVYSQAVDELVVEGRNGWRFVPSDAASVAAVLERALSTPDPVLSEMREHARSTVSRLTPQGMAGRIADTLEELVAPAVRGAPARV